MADLPGAFWGWVEKFECLPLLVNGGRCTRQAFNDDRRAQARRALVCQARMAGKRGLINGMSILGCGRSSEDRWARSVVASLGSVVGGDYQDLQGRWVMVGDRSLLEEMGSLDWKSTGIRGLGTCRGYRWGYGGQRSSIE